MNTKIKKGIKYIIKILLRPIKRFFVLLESKREFGAFKKLANDNRMPMTWKDRYYFSTDKTGTTKFDAHYIYHPAWAARILAKTNPGRHIDISSTLHFSTIVSAFMPVDFYDYRPAHLTLTNLTSNKIDLTSLPFKNESILSLSCMHTVEHIGLGRYGDPIDPNGDLKAIGELARVIAPGGNLLFVVPIGKPKIIFNAHRIYSYGQILEYFPGLKLKEFSLIPDNAREMGMVYDASKELADVQNYGCGCFWFQKQ